MARNFDVPPRDGRICYLVEGPTRWSVTVECPVERQAYRFDAPVGSGLRIGDHLRISGTVRMSVLLRKDGSPVHKGLPYYHDPHDGSPQGHWVFFTLLKPSWKRIPPPDYASALEDLSGQIQGLMAGWDSASCDQIQRFVRSVDKMSNLMRPVLKARRIEEQGRNAPVKALDLDV